MAHDVVYSSDTLSDLVVTVDLDIYINQTAGPCGLNASATVLHLAMRRILGREGEYPDFGVLKDEMIKAYGDDSADDIRQVLQEICPKYIICIAVILRQMGDGSCNRETSRGSNIFSH
jgi:hypothetical protein